MTYRHAEEMALRGRQIVSAAIDAASHQAMIGQLTTDVMDAIKNENADFPRLFASYGQTAPANSQAAIDDLFSVADNIDPTNSIRLDSSTLSQSGTTDGGLSSPL